MVEAPTVTLIPIDFRGREKSLARGACLLAILFGTSCGKKAAGGFPPPQVEVAAVIQRNVPNTHEWVGALDGYVNAEIRPEVEGYLLRQVYREGSLVRRGELLFEIDPRPFKAAFDQAKATLARDEATLAKTKLDVDRFTPLVAQKAVSQAELDNARTLQSQAEATVAGSRAAFEKAQLNLDWTRVTSPIDGIAGIAKSQVGNLVSGQSVMTTVSTVDPIKVYFGLSEQELLEWTKALGPLGSTPGAKGKGVLELTLSDGSTYPHKGNPYLADRSEDVKTGTLMLAGLFPNPDHLLRPGQYAKVRATLGVDVGAVLVPQRALSETQGNFQVAVVGPGNVVEMRAVSAGLRVGTFWVIEKGLRAGDRVVVEGLQKVKSGTVVNPMFLDAESMPGVPPRGGH